MKEHTYTIHEYYNGKQILEFLVRDDWDAETIIKQIRDDADLKDTPIDPESWRSCLAPDFKEWRKEIRARHNA